MKKLTDKDRLDWLEKHSEYSVSFIPSCNGWWVRGSDRDFYGASVRAAIDAAMASKSGIKKGS